MIHDDNVSLTSDSHHSKLMSTIGSAQGIVLRQDQTAKEMYTTLSSRPIRNRYAISLVPNDKHVAKTPKDDARWMPSGEELKSLESILFVTEDSFCEGIFDCLSRAFFAIANINNKRPLKLRFTVTAGGEVFQIRRPFRFGGCCHPNVMNMYSGSEDDCKLIGRVRSDFDNCFQSYCKCTFKQSVQKVLPTSEFDGKTQFEKLYTVRSSVCCCGTNNCCLASCLKNDGVFQILDKNEILVATIQKTYAYSSNNCFSACCRCYAKYGNYVLEFPKGSTPEARMLLVTSLFQLDYQFFEQQTWFLCLGLGLIN